MIRRGFWFFLLVVCCLPKGWGQIPFVDNLRDVEPGTCATAAQFCSASGLDITATSFHPFENGPYYDCLSSYMSTYNNPSRGRTTVWFYFKIKNPGTLTISLNSQSISGLFPDYCCWGPFNSKPTANQLTQSTLLNCDASNATNKTYTITNAQQDKFYIFALSYFYKKTSTVFNTISFEKIGGNATTYCPLDPILNATPSTLCQGENLVLEETSIVDANEYNWTGPDGQTHSGRVWNRGSATTAMSGQYSCVVIRGNEYGESTIDVLVTPQPSVAITADKTEICEGEEVTMHAMVSYDQPVPGDILCTDGSIVKPANWPCGKTAKGIVFYVDASGQHGWAVDKDITRCKVPNDLNNVVVKWSSNNYSNRDIPNLYNYTQWMEAVKDVNGYSNTQIIRDYTNATTNNIETYPAAWSVDFEHGWYIPAAGQLNVLFGEILVVNASLALSGIGGTQISSSGDMWSSTEFSSPDYTYVRALRIQLGGDVSTGRILHDDKKQKKTLRAVINF